WGVGCHPRHRQAQEGFAAGRFGELVKRTAIVGEIGLWVAAGSLGWTIFKRRKALIDRMFGRKPREV
ncbi:MAG: hypothetical protein RDU12_02875, partial [Brevundimonas sp.]|nr:hypothetical protein [Brevundimonas sp.]